MAVFLMSFREAFELAMLCSIVATYLIIIGQRDRIRDVWTGIGAATISSIIFGAIIYVTLQHYNGTSLELKIEGISFFLTFSILTYMATWIKKHENVNEELKLKVDTALKTGSKFAIIGLIFLIVFREGIEMVVFMIPLASISEPILNIVLGILGIMCGGFIGYLIYALGKKINVKYIFTILPILLIIFAAGFFVGGIGAFQELGWLTFGNHIIWDTSSIIGSKSTAGHLLHGLAGYTDRPTTLQVFGYFIYLVLVGITLVIRKRA